MDLKDLFRQVGEVTYTDANQKLVSSNLSFTELRQIATFCVWHIKASSCNFTSSKVKMCLFRYTTNSSLLYKQ